MKKVFITSCAVIVLSAGALIGWTNIHSPKAAPRAATTVKTHFTVETLANGTTVTREVPDTGQLPDIAPAAGGADGRPSTEPRFKYDPLTQTYRAPRADGGQDIIRDPLNPSKN